MPSGEPSGKRWMPSMRTEELARFAERTHDLDMEFLDREGEPMSSDEWIEAKRDPDYVLVAVDRVDYIGVITTWVGIHFDDNPIWQRVIFGTQIVYLHPEDRERMTGPPPDPVELMSADPEGTFNLLRIVEPPVGQVVGRFGWRSLSDAETGHRLAVDDFTKRFAAQRRSTE